MLSSLPLSAATPPVASIAEVIREIPLPKPATPASINRLLGRRITSSTLDAFDITDHTNGRLGVAYPAAGGRQWKAMDGEKPKYRWSDTPTGSYYHAPNAHQATIDAGGVLVLASGIADIWALHSAGIENAICWLNGENSIPDDIADHLQSWNVHTAHFFPDTDEAGHRSAEKLADMLKNSGILLHCHQLPDGISDVGDLWQSWDKPAPAFWPALLTLPTYKPQPTTLSASPPATRPQPHQVVTTPSSDFQDNSYLYALETGILIKLGIVEKNANGFSENIRCPNPNHEDKHPSAAWNYQTHSLHCKVCGDIRAIDVAEWVGVKATRMPTSAVVETPLQLSTETREKLLQDGHVNVARALDALYAAGFKPGETFTAADLVDTGISNGTAYKVIKAKHGGGQEFFQECDPSFSLERLEPADSVKNRQGRKPTFYQVPAPAMIARLVGSRPQHYDSLPDGAVLSPKAYRVAMRRVMLEGMARKNGDDTTVALPRSFEAERLGVSASTIRAYDSEAGVEPIPTIKQLAVIDDDSVALLPESRSDARGGQWLETPDGWRHQPTRRGYEQARQRMKAGRCPAGDVVLVERGANRYRVLDTNGSVRRHPVVDHQRCQGMWSGISWSSMLAAASSCA